MGEMTLFYRDLYPNWGIQETSTDVVPEPDDQDALNESETVAENTNVTKASKKNLLLAIVIIVCAVIFLGAA